MQLAALAEGHHLDLEVWQKAKCHGWVALKWALPLGEDGRSWSKTYRNSREKEVVYLKKFGWFRWSIITSKIIHTYKPWKYVHIRMICYLHYEAILNYTNNWRYKGLHEFFRVYNKPNERPFWKKLKSLHSPRVLAAIHEKGATLTNHLAGPAGEVQFQAFFVHISDIFFKNTTLGSWRSIHLVVLQTLVKFLG